MPNVQNCVGRSNLLGGKKNKLFLKRNRVSRNEDQEIHPLLFLPSVICQYWCYILFDTHLELILLIRLIIYGIGPLCNL